MDERENQNKPEQNDRIAVPDTSDFDEQYGAEMRKELQRIHEIEHGNAEEAAEQDETHAKGQPPLPDAGATGKKKKKRRKKHGFFWFCFVVSVVIGGVVFLNSSFFNIETITVRGNRNVSATEIIRNSGIRYHTNIFHVFQRTVRNHLKQNSYVESVSLKRRLPGELVLQIQERDEAACLPCGKEYIIIDDHGYVLRMVSHRPELTLVDGLTIRKMTRGEPLQVSQTDRLKEALSLIQNMNRNGLFFKRIVVGNVVLRVYIYDKLVVRGTYDNLRTVMKNGAVKDIIYDLYRKKIKKGTINITNHETCAYSPKVE